MNITINSKTYGEWNFWMSDNGGYIHLGDDSLGRQICENGHLSGKTLSASADNFRQVCYQWLKQHCKHKAEGRLYQTFDMPKMTQEEEEWLDKAWDKLLETFND